MLKNLKVLNKTADDTPANSNASKEANKLRDLAFENSLLANIITISESGKIIIVNAAACKLLGYSRKELVTKTRADIFDVNEISFNQMLSQRQTEGHSIASVTAIKKNGTRFPCEITSAVFTGEDGIERAITTIVSRKPVTEYKESFRSIFSSSSDVFFDYDLLTNKIIVSDTYESEFGYRTAGNVTTPVNWGSHIHPEDKEAVSLDYLRMLSSNETNWKCSYRFLKADNSVVDTVSSSIILRNGIGKAYRIVGFMHDISKQEVLEERVEAIIKLKEKEIEQAAEQAKETERLEIGKELHDNVNQLLGASRLYLNMAKRGGSESEKLISRSSEYTLMAIEEIRRLSRGLVTENKRYGLYPAIDHIIRDIMEVSPLKITCCRENFVEHCLDDKFKLNALRIFQEQMNNILKHSKATEVTITLTQNTKSVILTVADNGVGFDISKNGQGIGIRNIKSRASTYNGSTNFVSQPGKGCTLSVTFPLKDALLKENVAPDSAEVA